MKEVENKEIIRSAIEYVTELFRNNSGGHDAGHTMRVYRNTVRIAEKEAGCDLFVASLSALLHDADDHKLFMTENNANARFFLKGAGVSDEMTEEICRNINSVSFSKNRGRRPETAEGRVVQDADRLDAIGAVGIARTFAFGGEHGRPIEDSVQHFYDKLFLLKDEMNTETARKIAESRHEFMATFIRELKEETEE